MTTVKSPQSDGGAAFPAAPNLYYSDTAHGQRGMTLRAWLTGQALNGLLHSAAYGAELKRIFDRDEAIANAEDEKESPQEYTARLAISLAEAAIRQLEKSQTL